MKKKKDDEDERIAKAVAEMDAKKKEEEEEKERKHREVVAQCLQHMKDKVRSLLGLIIAKYFFCRAKV